MPNKTLAAHLGHIASLLLFTVVSWSATPLFQDAKTYNLGLYALSITTADVNGDGKLDLLMGDGGSAVGVALGNGDGTFPAVQSYNSGGWRTYPIVVGDVNGDNHLDLIVASSCVSSNSCDHGVVTVLPGNGDGTFRAGQTYSSGGYDSRSVAVGDVNGDRILDIIVTNVCVRIGDCSSGGVAVLLGNGDGTFQSAQTYASGSFGADGVALSDVNGNGTLDVLVSNYCSGDCYRSGSVGVLLGNGDGTLQVSQNYASDNGNAIAVGDVNQDGRPDVILPTYCGHGDACMRKGVQMLLGGSGGIFRSAQTFYSGGKSATSIAVQDVSRDGKLDLIVSNYCDNGNTGCRFGVIGVLLGNGDGTFQRAPQYASGSSHALAIAIGDVNGDGKADFSLPTESWGFCSVQLDLLRLSLTSSLDPSFYGQSLSLVSTVSSFDSSTPTGAVYSERKQGAGRRRTQRRSGHADDGEIAGRHSFHYGDLQGDSDSAQST